MLGLRRSVLDVDEHDPEVVVLDRPDAIAKNVVRLDDGAKTSNRDSRVLLLEVLHRGIATVGEANERDEKGRRLDAVLRLVHLSESLREQDLLDVRRRVGLCHCYHRSFRMFVGNYNHAAARLVTTPVCE